MTSLGLGQEIVGKSVLILVVACVASTLAGRRSAALRHFVWTLGFITLLLLIPLGSFLPKIPVPILEKEGRLASDVSLGGIARVELPATGSDVDFEKTDGLPEPTRVSSRANVSPIAVAEPAPSNQLDKPVVARRFFHKPSLDFLLLLVWVAGSGIAVLRLAKDLRRLRGLYLHGTSAFEYDGASELYSRVGLVRAVDLRIAATEVPRSAMTWGYRRPIVLLPRESVSWSRERLDAVLLHELAHVRRSDFASQLLADLACALYWFNPLVWLCARAMRSAAESAADDAVLRCGIKPSAYAAELLRIATEIGPRRQFIASLGVPMLNKPKIESRIVAILSPHNRRRGASALELVCTLAMAGLGMTTLCMLHATASRPAQVQVQLSNASGTSATLDHQDKESLKVPNRSDSVPHKSPATTQKGRSQPKLTSAQAHLVAAEGRFAAASETLRVEEELYCQGMVSMRDRDVAANAAKVAQSQLEQARAMLLLTQKIARPPANLKAVKKAESEYQAVRVAKELEIAQFRLSEAKVHLSEIKRQVAARLLLQDDLFKAETEVRTAQTQFEEAQSTLRLEKRKAEQSKASKDAQNAYQVAQGKAELDIAQIRLSDAKAHVVDVKEQVLAGVLTRDALLKADSEAKIAQAQFEEAQAKIRWVKIKSAVSADSKALRDAANAYQIALWKAKNGYVDIQFAVAKAHFEAIKKQVDAGQLPQVELRKAASELKIAQEKASRL